MSKIWEELPKSPTPLHHWTLLLLHSWKTLATPLPFITKHSTNTCLSWSAPSFFIHIKFNTPVNTTAFSPYMDHTHMQDFQLKRISINLMLLKSFHNNAHFLILKFVKEKSACTYNNLPLNILPFLSLQINQRIKNRVILHST